WAENKELHLKILQVNNQDWNELIKQCEYGFTFADSRIQLARSKAFSIDITKIDPRPYDRSEQTEYKNEKTEGNSSEKNSTDTNFKVTGDAGVDKFVKIQTEVDHKSEYSTSKASNISKMKPTIVGGEDAEHWQIIYYDIRPIFELLSDDLKNKVLKAFGKRILKSGITTHGINSQGPTIIIERDSEFEDLTSNPVHECQIFALIMQQDDNHRYYLRVHYIDEHTPAFVVHCDTGKKNKNKSEHEIQIGWIIVGYSKTFEDCMIECEALENDLSFTKKLMCITECPDDGPSKHNLYKSKVVTSIHFSSESSACLLVHNLDKENNVNDDNYIKTKILFGYINKDSLERLNKKIIAVNIKPNKPQTWESLLGGDENFISSDGKRKNFIYPLFMNVTNDCRLTNTTTPNNNCSQHGLALLQFPNMRFTLNWTIWTATLPIHG
ncbi:15726_t:CDS:2, partial [Dentiscutata heterogama]